MKIKDLKIGQGNVNLEAIVIQKSQPRTFEKFGKTGKVCDVTIKDDSGEIKLTLWNDQIDSVNVGNKIIIKNGYVSEFRGEKQLSTGKFGMIEVIDNKSKDLGSHILTDDEKEEAEVFNEEFKEPDIDDEITEDELEDADESEILRKKVKEKTISEEEEYNYVDEEWVE